MNAEEQIIAIKSIILEEEHDFDRIERINEILDITIPIVAVANKSRKHAEFGDVL